MIITRSQRLTKVSTRIRGNGPFDRFPKKSIVGGVNSGADRTKELFLFDYIVFVD